MTKITHKRTRGEKITTPRARLSFPFLFIPDEDEKGKKKYRCSLLFPPGADLEALKKSYREVAMEAFGGKKPPNFRSPFRKAEEKAHIPGYEDGWTFISCSSKRRPGIVNGKREAITDEEKMYPGCWVRATVNAFSYDFNGNRGVSFGLRNLQWVGEGEAFGGHSKAENDFEEIEEIKEIKDVEGGDEEFVTPDQMGKKSAESIFE